MEHTHPVTRQQKPTKKLEIVIIAGAGIVTLLLLAGIWFMSQHPALSGVFTPTNSKTTVKQASQPLPLEATVHITDTGFSPETVAIKKGNAVRWINETKTDNVSVNSDNYPTNRLYPELNLGKVSKGSTIVHISQSPGTYNYHNQFNPKQTGKINVE